MKKFFAPILCSAIFIGCGGPPSTPNQNVATPSSSSEQVQQELPAPTIKVYVENSGSMYGYVEGTTDFENAVYSYLSDIQLADLGEKVANSAKNVLELNYINSKVIKHSPDIEEFIKKLEPAEFKLKGGNMGTSDMSDILKTILSQITDNEIAIFVSDCILSPGSKYQTRDNADEYLVSNSIGVKNNFYGKISECQDFSVVVLRLISQFNGTYYNKFDEKTTINANRPYYIWLMGNRSNLKKVMNEVGVDKIKGSGVQNIYMASKPIKSLSYGILPQQSIGNFKPDPANTKTSVLKAKPVKTGGNTSFQLAIGVDFSELLLPDEYLTNPDNYSVSNMAYELEIVKNKNLQSSYTHIIKLNLTAPIISKGTVKITLNNSMPTWVEEYTDEVGLDINAEGAMEKTYGLKYLIGGVYDAYASNKEQENNHGVITVNIQ